MHLRTAAHALLALLTLAPAAAARGHDHVALTQRFARLPVDRGHRVERCAPARVWVPGHYEVRIERTWVEGCERRVWVPARVEWRRDACGRGYAVQVCAGYWRVEREPGRYESRKVSVWVPGHWQERARY